MVGCRGQVSIVKVKNWKRKTLNDGQPIDRRDILKKEKEGKKYNR